MLDALLFAVNAVLPLVLTVMVGYVLKRMHLMDDAFAKTANKAVFKVFLPCMLFLNIYGIDLASTTIDPAYMVYVAVAVLIAFAVALVTVPLVTRDKAKQAPLAQAAFRSNYALIGVPLAEAIGGAQGAAVASVLVAVSIPLFNVLAVVLFSLSATDGKKPSVKQTLLGIVKNPLILGVALGLVCLLCKNVLATVGVSTTLQDITPVYKTLTYLKQLATPLALLMLGAQFEFSAVASLKRELLYGVLMRVLLVPAAAIGIAYAMGIFTPSHIACFIGIFATPVAVSTVPMAQELGGDATLAGQLVVWTTLFSALSMFAFAFLFKCIGVF